MSSRARVRAIALRSARTGASLPRFLSHTRGASLRPGLLKNAYGRLFPSGPNETVYGPRSSDGDIG